MRMSDAISMFLHDMRTEGRITSAKSERSYYDVLAAHQEDVRNRDPTKTGRTDVKHTLQRWPNPNTAATRRATLCSFYDWMMEEGYRKDNPARQTRRPKKRPVSIYRLQPHEVLAMMDAVETTHERRAIYLGFCAGLRATELIGLKPLHFQRDGLIWVSPDIAKGGRERYIPVLAELQPIVDEILANVAPSHFVLCASKSGILEGRPPHHKRVSRFYPAHPMAANTLYRLTVRVGRRAGIPDRPTTRGAKKSMVGVNPHLMRHAFCDHVSALVGIEVAQALMGHADIATTQMYRSRTTLDQLSQAVQHIRFRAPDAPRTPSLLSAGATPPQNDEKLPPLGSSDSPALETVGIEPTVQVNRDDEPGGGGTEK